MYSLVIPTMWRGVGIQRTLLDAEAHSLIGEIIVINNAADKTPGWFKAHQWTKVRHYNFGRNIYVNPAWDAGIRKSANEKICIASDDIVFDSKVYDAVYEHLTEDSGCIGTAMPTSVPIGEIKIVTQTIPRREANGCLPWGYANLFFMHKKNYLQMPIPKQFMIFFGDDWVYDASWVMKKNPKEITNFNIMLQERRYGITSQSPEFIKVREHDVMERDKLGRWLRLPD